VRFADLNPKITGSGIVGVNELSFDCPKCGKPFRVDIHCRLNGPADQAKAIWAWSGDFTKPSYDSVSIQPSISNHHHGRKECGWHGSITNGEVLP
jgi:Family of unknown function (DUF6527)